jgi:PAS domain-containing protein
MAVRSQGHRRRRRRRSSRSRVVTRPLSATRAGRQFQLHSAEVLASIGVVVAAATLLALIWLVAFRSIDTERNDVRARNEARVSGQAVVFAEQIRLEMLGIDQSLLILKEAFQADPDHFDMDAWRKQMPALTDATDDAFIVDAQYIIRHDINPAQVGLGIGSRVPGMFGPAGDKPVHDEDLLVEADKQSLRLRQHPLLMLMRLDRPGGWLVGASYRTDALKRLFAEANLGVRGMTALIDTRLGRVQAVAGPAAAVPNYDIATSAMYAAMQLRPDGTWIGASAPDGVQRIHGFRRVPGHQLAVIVAVDEAEAMLPATVWARDVRSLAIVATLVVLTAMGIALYAVWTFRAKRRLRERLDRELNLVANTQAELAETRARLGGSAGQVQALFAGIEEGALVLDAQLHLAEWNRRFPELFGIAAEALRPGLPFDELLRVQAREGAFGTLEDIEADVSRRLAQLRSGSESVPLLYAGPGGRTLAVFTSRHADGSLLLVVREAAEHDLRHAADERGIQVLEASPTTGSAETF